MVNRIIGGLVQQGRFLDTFTKLLFSFASLFRAAWVGATEVAVVRVILVMFLKQTCAFVHTRSEHLTGGRGLFLCIFIAVRLTTKAHSTSLRQVCWMSAVQTSLYQAT